jgi:predicted nucleic acid-binding protein
MTRYILDTGILVGYLRGAGYADYVEQRYAPFTPPNIGFISIVTAGELYSLAIQFRWGQHKRDELASLLQKIPRVDISSQQILERYAEIDSYSKGKHPSKHLGLPAIKMGKNDLWIAASASVLASSLLTLDDDFSHLNGVFFPVIRIDQSSKP